MLCQNIGVKIISHGNFPEVGQKLKTEKKRKKERKKDQKLVITMAKLCVARKHACRTQAAWAKKRLSFGTKKIGLDGGNNNAQATHGTRKNTCRTQAAWAKKCSVRKKFVAQKNLVLKELLGSKHN